MNQLEMVSLEDLISPQHSYRKFRELLDFEHINGHLQKLKKDNPHEGYGLDRLFKCLFLQFLEEAIASWRDTLGKQRSEVVLRFFSDGKNSGSYGFHQRSGEDRSIDIGENFWRPAGSTAEQGLHERGFYFHRRDASDIQGAALEGAG